VYRVDCLGLGLGLGLSGWAGAWDRALKKYYLWAAFVSDLTVWTDHETGRWVGCLRFVLVYSQEKDMDMDIII